MPLRFADVGTLYSVAEHSQSVATPPKRIHLLDSLPEECAHWNFKWGADCGKQGVLELMHIVNFN